MKNSGYDAWMARISWVREEYEFGPFQRYVNEEGNLHRDNGPALITPTKIVWYQNGRKHGIDADIFGTLYYYYENIRVPPHFITKPDSVTIEEVLANKNAEIRFVGMKIVGMEKVLKHKNTRIVDVNSEKDQILFCISGIFSEDVMYVKVVNSTAEPDGSFKNYYLCVPPEMKTCAEAVAWTFGLEAKDYAPEQET